MSANRGKLKLSNATNQSDSSIVGATSAEKMVSFWGVVMGADSVKFSYRFLTSMPVIIEAGLWKLNITKPDKCV